MLLIPVSPEACRLGWSLSRQSSGATDVEETYPHLAEHPPGSGLPRAPCLLRPLCGGLTGSNVSLIFWVCLKRGWVATLDVLALGRYFKVLAGWWGEDHTSLYCLSFSFSLTRLEYVSGLEVSARQGPGQRTTQIPDTAFLDISSNNPSPLECL